MRRKSLYFGFVYLALDLIIIIFSDDFQGVASASEDGTRIFSMKHLMTPKGQSAAANRRRIENIRAKRKRKTMINKTLQ